MSREIRKEIHSPSLVGFVIPPGWRVNTSRQGDRNVLKYRQPNTNAQMISEVQKLSFARCFLTWVESLSTGDIARVSLMVMSIFHRFVWLLKKDTYHVCLRKCQKHRE